MNGVEPDMQPIKAWVTLYGIFVINQHKTKRTKRFNKVNHFFLFTDMTMLLPLCACDCFIFWQDYVSMHNLSSGLYLKSNEDQPLFWSSALKGDLVVWV